QARVDGARAGTEIQIRPDAVALEVRQDDRQYARLVRTTGARTGQHDGDAPGRHVPALRVSTARPRVSAPPDVKSSAKSSTWRWPRKTRPRNTPGETSRISSRT